MHVPVETVVCGDFTKGASYTNWRPRGSGDWLLIYTRAGGGLVTAGGRRRRLGAGEAVLFGPGAAQDYATDPEAEMWRLQWAHFRPPPEWVAWLRWPEVAPAVGWWRFDDDAERTRVEAALDRMLQLSVNQVPGAAELTLNALEETVLWARSAMMGAKAGELDPRVRHAMDYLAAELGRAVRLPEVARRCGLSVSRLSHLFREQVGQTPQRYAEELRLRRARELLAHTGLRVQEVALETGFVDALYFSKRFRGATGCSPSEYRRRGGSGVDEPRLLRQ